MTLDSSPSGIAAAVKELEANYLRSEHITYLKFPNFKNIDPATIIEFTSPLTVLVGANGTNKSSVLKALRGCINQVSISSMWFSTEIDVIADRSQYIYGYYNAKYSRIVEVLQTRIYDRNNPDYWETSRPLSSLGMESVEMIQQSTGSKMTRWPKIRKGVVYIDFRSELSAFDRTFYRREFKKSKRFPTIQAFLRYRTDLIKKSIDTDKATYTWHNVNRLYSNRLLSETSLRNINDILGQKYTEIRVLDHSFFGERAFTFVIRDKNLNYSEAFAGSGEIAIISLIDRIESIKKNSLILLDEPEVSIHPGAQSKLLAYLIIKCKTQGHQIVVSSHSSHIIDSLPKECIRLFSKRSDENVYVREASSNEAFYYLGAQHEKLDVYVEDNLSQFIVRKIAADIDPSVLNRINVNTIPGGAKTIKSWFLADFAQTKRSAYFILDGDEAPPDGVNFRDPDYIPPSENHDLDDYIYSILGCNPRYAENSNDVNKIETRREFIKYIYDRLEFFPFITPEIFIIEYSEEKILKNLYNGLSGDRSDCAKIAIREYSLTVLGLPSANELNSSQILTIQMQLLNNIPRDNECFNSIKAILEKIISQSPLR